MVELFQLEVENQGVVLTENLLALEQNPTDASRLETLMRAAHSLKGAARMVNREIAVGVAHGLEDVFVAVQRGPLVLEPEHVDVLLRSVDLLKRIAQTPEDKIDNENSDCDGEVQKFLSDLAKVRAGELAKTAKEVLQPPEPEGADSTDSIEPDSIE